MEKKTETSRFSDSLVHSAMLECLQVILETAFGRGTDQWKILGVTPEVVIAPEILKTS